MLEVKKRDRWQSDQSICRYEKAARLAQVQGDLTKAQLAFFQKADTQLEDLVSGRVRPSVLPPVVA